MKLHIKDIHVAGASSPFKCFWCAEVHAVKTPVNLTIGIMLHDDTDKTIQLCRPCMMRLKNPAKLQVLKDIAAAKLPFT